jgi:hypothetical protein
MPERDGQFEYRVRSSYELYEKVLRESQLRAEREQRSLCGQGIRWTRATGKSEKAHDNVSPGGARGGLDTKHRAFAASSRQAGRLELSLPPPQSVVELRHDCKRSFRLRVSAH